YFGVLFHGFQCRFPVGEQQKRFYNEQEKKKYHHNHVAIQKNRNGHKTNLNNSKKQRAAKLRQRTDTPKLQLKFAIFRAKNCCFSLLLASILYLCPPKPHELCALPL